MNFLIWICVYGTDSIFVTKITILFFVIDVYMHFYKTCMGDK